MKAALLIGAIVSAFMLSGCATTQPSEQVAQCELVAAAYYEIDELGTGWYDTAAALLVECGYALDHKLGCRGRDPGGHYNMDKDRCVQ